MLNENDFSEIGKRMYGLEAEPPERGWEKIAGGLKNGRKGNFFTRHWWKSLFLLIPVLLYVANEQGLLSTGSLSAGLKLNNGSTVKPSDDTTTDLSATSEITDSAAALLKENLPSLQSTLTNPAEESGTSTARTTIPKGPSNNATANFTPATSTTKESIAATSTVNIERSPSQNEAQRLITNQVADSFYSESPSGGTAHTESQGRNEIAIAKTPSDGKNSSGSNTLSENDGVTKKDDYASDSTSAISEKKGTRAVASAVAPLHGNPEKEKTAPETRTSMDASKELPIEKEEHEEEQEGTQTWRVTALFTPHFVRKSVRPVENDEVFITNLDRKKAFDRAGFGLAIGIGKQIRPNLFLDVQATFSSQREQFSWTYTTGDVDTLIARQESNGAVRVVPVYNSASAGIQSKLNYAGVQVGGTYYFWSQPRRRFNVSALAGINTLVYSNVRENISGTWVKLNQDDLAKTMYNFTISAGYNLRLGAAWEVQLNPSITYYTGKENSYQQLRNLNQRSYGITLLMTRYF